MDIESYILGRKSAGGGGGSDLPAVTSSDNGDVLTVVNGAWDKAVSAVFPIGVDTGTFLLTMTWQEIRDELLSGKIGVLQFNLNPTEGEVRMAIITGAYVKDGLYVIAGPNPQSLDYEYAFAEHATDYPGLD